MSSRLALLFPLALVAMAFAAAARGAREAKRPAIAVVSVVILAGLAGCSSGGGGGSNAGGGDDAIDSEVARAAATLKGRAWNDDAEMIILGTLETLQDPKAFLESTEDSEDGGSFGSASRFFLEEFLPDSDEDVGDGDAGTWFAVFSAPGEAVLYVVAVTHDGESEGQEVQPEEDEMEYTPVGDYDIDSNSALQRAAAKGGQQFEDAMNAPDGGVFYALVGPMEGYEAFMPNALWLVMSISETEDPSIIFVDAQTGHATDFADMMDGFGGGN